jgi:hypothetical protein
MKTSGQWSYDPRILNMGTDRGECQLLAPVALVSGKEPPAFICHETRVAPSAEENSLFPIYGMELCFIQRLAVTYSLCSDLHGKCLAVVVDFMAALRSILSSTF